MRRILVEFRRDDALPGLPAGSRGARGGAVGYVECARCGAQAPLPVCRKLMSCKSASDIGGGLGPVLDTPDKGWGAGDAMDVLSWLGSLVFRK